MNYKIFVGNLTEIIQKRLFDYGYRWGTSSNIFKQASYLFISTESKYLSYVVDNYKFFLKQKEKEITLTEFFQMFPEKVETLLSEEMKKDMENEISTSAAGAGYRYAIRKYLPKVEILETENKVMKNYIKMNGLDLVMKER